MEVSDSRKRLKNKTVESAQRSASRMCWQSHLCKVTPCGLGRHGAWLSQRLGRGAMGPPLEPYTLTEELDYQARVTTGAKCTKCDEGPKSARNRATWKQAQDGRAGRGDAAGVRAAFLRSCYSRLVRLRRLLLHSLPG